MDRKREYCNCKSVNCVTTGVEDDFGCRDVCVTCGKRLKKEIFIYAC